MQGGINNANHRHAQKTDRQPRAFAHSINNFCHEQASNDKTNRGQPLLQAIFEFRRLNARNANGRSKVLDKPNEIRTKT